MGRIIDIPGGQKSEAWHAHRATYRNASDAPAMMGVSPYVSRTEFLKRTATGVTPEPDARTQALFNDGHRSERLCRPLAEAALDEDLSPLVMVEGNLSASLDGHTLDDSTDWEHKRLNDRLRAVLPATGIGGPEVGRALPMDYRVQIAQQQHCSGARRTLFSASKWSADDSLIEARHCWVERDEALIAQVVAGWAQFDKDVAAYKPAEPAAQLVTADVEYLPAVSVQTTGTLAVKSNLDVFGVKLREFIAKLPKEPETDQEFADLDAACKRLEAAEKAIEAAVNGALASVTDVEAMRVTALQLAEIARTARLASEKVVKNRKDEIKAREVRKRAEALDAYVSAANTRLGGSHVLPAVVDFGAAIKGLRSLDSLRDKLDTALANAKIAVDAAEKRIAANLKTIADAGQDLQALFADKALLVQKDPEAVAAIVAGRVNEHRAAEARKIAEAQDRARQEEAARIAAEQKRQAEEAAAAAAAAAAIQRAQETAPAADAGGTPAAVAAVADAAQPAAGEPENPAQEREAGPTYLQAVATVHRAQGAEVLTASAATPAAEEPTIKLGDIIALLAPNGGFMTGAYVRDVLGVPPTKTERGALWFTLTQRAQIKAALLKRIAEVL